ncbi:MAG: Entericidin EcnAB [Ponticaulis sp.]|nr:Entericidin EcnAB [Ponticaulis sp.]|tara:strand:+ start:270 stop:443 length:174 start_codon:yes stop_codon:yes gene_type:complete
MRFLLIASEELKMKNWLKFMTFGMVALMVTACNTVEGVGEDVVVAGDAIEDAGDTND